MDGELFSAFMHIAEPNTTIGLETCGILAGRAVQVLLVNHSNSFLA